MARPDETSGTNARAEAIRTSDGDGAGHWVQQERANEVNAALIAFLKESRS